jgi:hypothetical protein
MGDVAPAALRFGPFFFVGVHVARADTSGWASAESAVKKIFTLLTVR